MSSAVSNTGAAFPELFLKTTPPRAPRHQLVRPRLSLDGEQFSDCSVTVVQAPAGFGKTALLGQWRREYLARGAAVAWVSADERDDLKRFLHSLVLAVRTGCLSSTTSTRMSLSLSFSSARLCAGRENASPALKVISYGVRPSGLNTSAPSVNTYRRCSGCEWTPTLAPLRKVPSSTRTRSFSSTFL